MCRNIKTLFNFEPPATDDEVRDAALQFVRKLSGTDPSRASATSRLRPGGRRNRRGARAARFAGDQPGAENREEEAAKAKARAALRFAS